MRRPSSSCRVIFIPLAAVQRRLGVIQVYARMTMQRRWRAWLNDALVDRWLTNGRYYQLNLVGGDHENPEYRIADDVRVATEAPVDFASGVTHGVPVGGDLHRRAVDDRRRADVHRWRHRRHHPGLSGRSPR